MAAKRPRSEDTYDDIMTCPVCTNEFKDPRLLSCGHHFCYWCLEKIAQGQKNGSIPCPTCRYITTEEAENLPKMQLNEFQTKVSIFLEKKRAKVDKFCGFCEESVSATWTCKECQLPMCDACRQGHETLENISGHRVTSMSNEQFCSEHPDSLICCSCENCSIFLCHRCVVKHDKSHIVADIKETAEKAKERLTNIVLKKDSIKTDKVLQRCVKEALTKLKDNDEKMNKHIADIEDSISALQDKVRRVKEEKDCIYQKELKELQILEHDVADFINTKEELIQHVTDLLTTGSDSEIISREKEFPKYASDSVKTVFNIFTFELPKAQDLSTIAEAINSLENNLILNSDDTPITTNEMDAMKQMKARTLFKACAGAVCGLAYNPSNDTYVVRSTDAEKLIQVFDTSGKHITTFGSKREGICRDGRIDIDTRRKLYLLPTVDGKIVTIDYEGKEDKVIDVGRFRLYGISYIILPDTNKDRYIVSSAGYAEEKEEASHSIYIIDAADGTVLTEIKNEANVSNPYSVSSFTSPQTGAIIVAGYYRGQIRVYDINGKLTSIITEHRIKELRNMCHITSGIVISDASQNAIFHCRFEKGKKTLDDPKLLLRANIPPNNNTDFEILAFDWKKRCILFTFRRGNKVFVITEI